MKKLLVGLCTIFICTFAIAHTIEWYVDDSLYQTTTCEAGDSITPPVAPEKYGYHFVKWDEGYTQLEYIESTGTQYIDTGVNLANKKIGVVLDFQLLSAFSGNILIGGTTADNTSNYRFGLWTYEDVLQWRTKINSIGYYSGEYDTNRHILEFNTVNGTKLDNTVIDANQYTLTSTYNVLILKELTGSYSSAKAKIYSCKIYNGSTLIQNLIPCRRNSDSVLGMYDTVSGTFFTNAGTGEFIAGPEVGELW